MARVTLPTESDDRLVKVLLIGDSQMGQSSNRLAGQVQKWDADIVGRLLSCEYQGGAGVLFTSVTGAAYGAVLDSERIGLGDDHGDGNTGSHFHHSRRFTVQGSVQPNFSELGSIALLPGAYARPPDFDTRKNARVAVYDKPGGFARFRLTERRGATSGQSTDFGLPGDPGPELTGSGQIRLFHQRIRAAADSGFGTPGSMPVGLIIRDSNNLDANRTLNLLGALIHDSPEGDAFPGQGLVVSHISQPGWSAFDHLNTLTDDALDAIIRMNEGLDTVFIVLGHNREDDYHATNNPDAYPANMQALAERVSRRHLVLGYATPGFVMVAPWPIATVHNPRLRTQTDDLAALCARHGHGFINLFDFFAGMTPEGPMTTPRGTFSYNLDPYLTHPADAATASHLMRDVEWSFHPNNWADGCPPDLAEPLGTLNFFDLAAYLTLFNAQSPDADLAEPAGVLNFFDLAAYLGAFNAGCP
jgi:lysophospholipase L1-like esterase